MSYEDEDEEAYDEGEYEIEGTNSTFGIFLAFIIQIAAPIVLVILWTKITKTRFLPIIIGIVNYLITIIIEAIAILLIGGAFEFRSGIFVILIIIFQGIFEEIGRFICFKVFVNSLNEKATSVSFGLGHGGAEIIAQAIEIIMVGTDDMSTYITFSYCFGEIIEHLTAFALHIALSVIMFVAARKNNYILFGADIAIHDIADMFIILYEYVFITSRVVAELIFIVITLGGCALAYHLYMNTLIESSNAGLISGSTETPQTPLTDPNAQNAQNTGYYAQDPNYAQNTGYYAQDPNYAQNTGYAQ